MPRKCVFGCPPATRGVLHVFPSQKRFPEQFKAWMELIPHHLRPPQNNFNHTRVCDRHFTKEDRNRFNRLNALAVPRLYLLSSALVLHRFPNPLLKKEKFLYWKNVIGGDILKSSDDFVHKYRRICRMHFENRYLCRNNRVSDDAIPTLNMPGSVLHVFPNPDTTRDRFECWKKAIGGDILTLGDKFIQKNRRVCHLHFEKKYLCRKNRISNIAIPTLNMPGSTLINSTQPLLEIRNLADLDLHTSKTKEKDPLSKVPNETVGENVVQDENDVETIDYTINTDDQQTQTEGCSEIHPNDHMHKTLIELPEISCDSGYEFEDLLKLHKDHPAATSEPINKNYEDSDVIHKQITENYEQSALTAKQINKNYEHSVAQQIKKYNERSAVISQQINKNSLNSAAIYQEIKKINEHSAELTKQVLRNSCSTCRCCLNDTELISIWDECEFNGERQVFALMLNECFDINMVRSEEVEMICCTCIQRLQEAYQFKKEILATQELIKEGLCILNLDSEMKMEVEDPGVDGNGDEYEEVEYLSDAMEEAPSSSQAPKKWPKKKIRSERNKTYKQYTQEDLKNAIERVQRGDMSCAEAAEVYGIPKNTLSAKVASADSKEVDEAKEAANKRHHQLIEEIKKLLAFTTATPFRTRATRYYCFYCSTDGPNYEDPDELRKHTRNEHTNDISRIDQYMKPQWMNEVIKLDVDDLHCDDCDILLPDWNHMFEHFAEVHKIEFDEAYTKVIPYALTSQLECKLCHENFHNFGHLDSHMNHHYSNHVCYKCGDTFLAQSRLDKHLKVHEVGYYQCSLCEKVFTLEKYRSKHINLVHKQERNIKCLYCEEKFIATFQRHIHVTEKHKDKVRTFTCDQCGKSFTWKPYFLMHMRRKHGVDVGKTYD